MSVVLIVFKQKFDQARRLSSVTDGRGGGQKKYLGGTNQF